MRWKPGRNNPTEIMAERVDAIVLGLGVGGEEIANTLADNGLNVVGIENHLVGGECPYYGCIPTKMMIRADDMLAEGRRIPGFAGDAMVKSDWTPVTQRIRTVATDNWDDRIAVERFERKGGHFVRGAGRLAGTGTVSVNGTTRSSVPFRTVSTWPPGASDTVIGVTPRRSPSTSTSDASGLVWIVRLPGCG